MDKNFVDTSQWPETLEYAPIVTIPYMRYEILKNNLNALKNNTLAAKSVLFCFCDAPGRPEHVKQVQRVREYLHNLTGFFKIIIIERQENLGGVPNFKNASKYILDKYDRMIFLEDDIQTSPYFLQFMNDALNTYKNDPRIGAISAFHAPFKYPTPDIYFLKYYTCWGYATWKSWYYDLRKFSAEQAYNLLKERKLMKQFNYFSSFIIPHSRILRLTIQKVINADDICANANMFLQNKLAIFPPQSLSNHIGFGDGIHCTVKIKDYCSQLATVPIKVERRDPKQNLCIARSLHRWFLKVHLKLLVIYLFTLGPIRNFFKNKVKNKEF